MAKKEEARKKAKVIEGRRSEANKKLRSYERDVTSIGALLSFFTEEILSDILLYYLGKDLYAQVVWGGG